MKKRMITFEIAGLFFVIIMAVFLQNLYSLSGGAVMGIMFGSVNDSIWELAKTVLVAYIVWSIIEIMCLKAQFHRFVVARVISLYFLGLFYIMECLVFAAADGTSHSMPEFAAAIAAVLSASFLSYRFMLSDLKLERLFAPAVFMLLLFLALYCSFTPFPPKSYIFMDRTTGLYGIIPDYIDTGAIALDTAFS